MAKPQVLLIVLILCYLVTKTHQSSIQCSGFCLPLRKNICPGNAVPDKCGCDTCAKQAGQLCGGFADEHGFCDEMLTCVDTEESKGPKFQQVGKCISSGSSSRLVVEPPSYWHFLYNKIFGRK